MFCCSTLGILKFKEHTTTTLLHHTSDIMMQDLSHNQKTEKKHQPIVIKFGGSSMATNASIEHVCARIKEHILQGTHPVVVVSAPKGRTKTLHTIAKEYGSPPEIYDFFVSQGELYSVGLLSCILSAQQYSCRPYAGWQVPIQTSWIDEKNVITHIQTQSLIRDIQNNIIPIIAGFQGINGQGHVTTLPSGGSDTTAVALARALKTSVILYKDVDGIYLSNPHTYGTRNHQNIMNYDDVICLEKHGNPVVSKDALCFAKQHNIPLRVRSTFLVSKRETVITHTPALCPILGITVSEPLPLVQHTIQHNLPHVYGYQSKGNLCSYITLRVPEHPHRVCAQVRIICVICQKGYLHFIHNHYKKTVLNPQGLWYTWCEDNTLNIVVHDWQNYSIVSLLNTHVPCIPSSATQVVHTSAAMHNLPISKSVVG